MSTDRDTKRIVRSWLRTEENESADRVLGSVLDRLDATPQRRATRWPARRLPEMNNMARLALGAVAAGVAVAALLGYSDLIAPNVGGPVQPSQPPPTHEPGASIRADLPVLSDQSGPLDPGTYVVTEVEPLRIAITVPDGWSRNIAPATVWTDNSTVHIWFGRVDNLYADPCDAAGDPMDPPLGPTAQDLADALASYQEIEAAVSNVTVSGFPGRYVELSVADPTGDWCGGESRLWDIEEGQQLGLPGVFGTLGVWTFDVNGDRLVMASEVRAAAGPADAAGLDTIMESLEIQAP